MSVQHIALVLEAADLCAQEKAALVAFCNHTDATGKTFAGEERLMREAGMPRSTFRRWRAKLVERELLVSKQKRNAKNQRMTSDTWVNLRRLAEMRDPWFNRPGRPADEEDMNPFESPDSQVSPVRPGPDSQVSPVVNPGLTDGPYPGLTGETPNPQITLTSSIAREDTEPIGSGAGADTATDDDGWTDEEWNNVLCAVIAVRPEWHTPGIEAQIRKVQHLPYAQVRGAFVAAAEDRSVYSPIRLASAALEIAVDEAAKEAAAVRREHNNQALRAEINEDVKRRAAPETRKARVAEARELMNAQKRAG